MVFFVFVNAAVVAALDAYTRSIWEMQNNPIWSTERKSLNTDDKTSLLKPSSNHNLKTKS